MHKANFKALKDSVLMIVWKLVAEQETRFHAPSSLRIFARVDVEVRSVGGYEGLEYVVLRVLPMLHTALDLGKDGIVVLGSLGMSLGKGLKEFFLCHKREVVL
jgi:hypothetical protein